MSKSNNNKMSSVFCMCKLVNNIKTEKEQSVAQRKISKFSDVPHLYLDGRPFRNINFWKTPVTVNQQIKKTTFFKESSVITFTFNIKEYNKIKENKNIHMKSVSTETLLQKAQLAM